MADLSGPPCAGTGATARAARSVPPVPATVEAGPATVEPRVDAAAAALEAIVDDVAAAVGPDGRPVVAVPVQPVGLAVEPVVGGIAATLEAVLDPVAAPSTELLLYLADWAPDGDGRLLDPLEVPATDAPPDEPAFVEQGAAPWLPVGAYPR